mmetsp:Transcript_86189/g.263820  ORF Transcript_86189/g.263820 Transcript_86189/m.263820 type:complete len:230 (-) Transcript_86189:1510-2199(-)
MMDFHQRPRQVPHHAVLERLLPHLIQEHPGIPASVPGDLWVGKGHLSELLRIYAHHVALDDGLHPAAVHPRHPQRRLAEHGALGDHGEALRGFDALHSPVKQGAAHEEEHGVRVFANVKQDVASGQRHLADGCEAEVAHRGGARDVVLVEIRVNRDVGDVNLSLQLQVQRAGQHLQQLHLASVGPALVHLGHDVDVPGDPRGKIRRYVVLPEVPLEQVRLRDLVRPQSS